jgi:hypothetical protein
MAIIKTKDIYNIKNIHYSYRTVNSILKANSANRFCVFLIIKTQKKNAYPIVHNKLILLYIDN